MDEMEQEREHRFGQEAVEYIRECLNEGRTLSRCLWNRADLFQGTVLTRLPTSVTRDAATRFRLSILPEPPPEYHRHVTATDGSLVHLVPKPHAGAWVIEVITTFLSGGPDRLCVFENGLARASDSGLHLLTSRLAVFDDEVYHLLLATDVEIETIGRTIDEATHAYPPVVGVCSYVPSGRRGVEFSRLDAADLKGIAQRAECIVVSAYDGEGYLLWDRC